MKKTNILTVVLLLSFCLGSFLPVKAENTGKNSFTIGNKTFLLNGKPFVVKAAEIHYPRIPKEYWEHRIQMCKALGMNTICIYNFWNAHEQKPGEFDFTGQYDIAEFCRLAQKNDMYVIVRPGPYVCAEWEMGGLPWWLLKKKDIRLRTNDPYFLERTGIYLKEIGKQLAGLQITRGGNIIMVQVENEYGAYATDKEYIGNIRDILLEAGFTDVPLFQCDWSSNFKNNALDGLVWTINFGTGANIKKQFEGLEAAAPNAPLMCSEFWSGWFDHWGRAHETRDAKVMIDGMREMLDNNISFSLYMAHGGTTFGHWGGANSPAYSAMCSSYDYDAPISEAGWTTPKYFALRDMLKNYPDEGKEPAEIPQSMPVIEIPEIKFTEAALLFENLPAPVQTKDIQSMEEFDQGWGSILYRTTLPAVKSETMLVITEPHDWAQVFADGVLIARMDRRKGQNSVMLPLNNKPVQLDILVEAMGRVNFGGAIHDRKGITEKVEIVDSKGAKSLKNWEVFNLPVDYAFTSDKKFVPNKDPLTAPAYYRATFDLNYPGDVFLDMQKWGKGLVWVNGQAIGRFWEIGPQQTLFMPGCWLKKGKNEIIVLDLKGPEETIVRGLKEPILDMLRPEESILNRKPGETLDLSGEVPVLTGVSTPGNGWKEFLFVERKARYICIEGLNAHDGKEVAAIAELYTVGTDGKNMSRQSWKIAYADSENTRSGNNTAEKVFDLQESTYWKTASGEFPHQIVIDLGSVEPVKGIRMLPRVEEGAPGLIKDFKIYTKEEPFKITQDK